MVAFPDLEIKEWDFGGLSLFNLAPWCTDIVICSLLSINNALIMKHIHLPCGRHDIHMENEKIIYFPVFNITSWLPEMPRRWPFLKHHYEIIGFWYDRIIYLHFNPMQLLSPLLLLSKLILISPHPPPVCDCSGLLLWPSDLGHLSCCICIMIMRRSSPLLLMKTVFIIRLWFKCGMSLIGSDVWKLVPQLEVLVWKIVEAFRGEAILEEGSYGKTGLEIL